MALEVEVALVGVALEVEVALVGVALEVALVGVALEVEEVALVGVTLEVEVLLMQKGLYFGGCIKVILEAYLEKKSVSYIKNI